MPVAQINALASKFRVPYTAGDEMVVRLVKEGREHGQGVGYLDDGTMVVVEKRRGSDRQPGRGPRAERHPDDDRTDDLRRPRGRGRRRRRGAAAVRGPRSRLRCWVRDRGRRARDRDRAGCRGRRRLGAAVPKAFVAHRGHDDPRARAARRAPHRRRSCGRRRGARRVRGSSGALLVERLECRPSSCRAAPTRQASVRAALQRLPGDVALVAVHDAARSFAPAICSIASFERWPGARTARSRLRRSPTP